MVDNAVFCLDRAVQRVIDLDLDNLATECSYQRLDGTFATITNCHLADIAGGVVLTEARFEGLGHLQRGERALERIDGYDY